MHTFLAHSSAPTRIVQDEATKARRAQDRVVQREKAEALRARREAEALGTGAKRLGNQLLQGAKGLRKETGACNLSYGCVYN